VNQLGIVPILIYVAAVGEAGGGVTGTMSIARARSMRRKMPPAEAMLWTALRSEPLKTYHFRRQVPFGRYYADFAAHGPKLIVEVDGSTHFNDAASGYDVRRDAFLNAEGYRVLRFTTSDVLTNLDGVYTAILAACQS
jgi:very-short-patch-repair endonuclease